MGQSRLIDLVMLALALFWIHVLEVHRLIWLISRQFTATDPEPSVRTMPSHLPRLKQNVLPLVPVHKSADVVAIVERLLTHGPPPTDHTFKGIGHEGEERPFGLLFDL